MPIADAIDGGDVVWLLLVVLIIVVIFAILRPRL